MKTSFAFLLFLFGLRSFAAQPMPQVFEALRNSGEKYEVVGTVCEQVAKLDMQKIYPAPRFSVVTGISYSSRGRVVGELDVVVFDTGKAILIGEVKCWQSPSSALNKAKNQRQRFLQTLGRGGPIDFNCTNGTCRFARPAFAGVQKFISIAQKGTQNIGFDMELGYSLEDLMRLRQQLITCQNRRECARPTY